jgi:competence protein ComEA
MARKQDEKKMEEKWEKEDLDEESPESSKINLNTASKDELMQIEGLDEERAGRIIQYREENGGFESIEEIGKIPGFEEVLVEKVKSEATV